MALETVTIPHFDFPFHFERSGESAVVDQDTLEDVTNCVLAILHTHVNWRDEVPSFGIEELAFRNQPIGVDALAEDVMSQEPRARLIASERVNFVDDLIDLVNIQVSKRGLTP